MTLRTRLTLCLLVPMLATAGFAATVGSLGLLRTQAGLADARHVFVAGQVRAAIENGLTLGLPLEDLRQTSEILTRTAARDPDIAAILVFDAHGVVRYGSDPRRVGEPAPEAAWLQADPASPVQTLDDGGPLVLAPLVNSYGSVAGGLAVRFEEVGEAVRIEHTVAVIGGTTLLMAAAGTVAAVLAAGLCLSAQRRRLDALAARFAALAAHPEATLGGAPADTLAPSGDDALGAAGRRFEARAAAVWRDIAARQGEIERLDELA